MGEILTQYGSLKDAVDDLAQNTRRLDDPLDNYRKAQGTIGEGGTAWSGSAAAQVEPVLDAIKADILELQALTEDYSKKVNQAVLNYTASDEKGQKNISDIKV